MNKHFVSRLLLLCSFLILSSCGGGTTSGGVVEFKTVQASATASTNRLESNVITGNTCSNDGVSTGGSLVTDSVSVTITSILYPNFVGTASSLAITGYTVHFQPANPISPALPDQNGTNLGFIVPFGSSLSVPVAVAPDTLKAYLVTDKNLEPCSMTIYNYYVTITFNVVEVNTGESHPVQTTLNVEFADRVN